MEWFRLIFSVLLTLLLMALISIGVKNKITSSILGIIIIVLTGVGIWTLLG